MSLVRMFGFWGINDLMIWSKEGEGECDSGSHTERDGGSRVNEGRSELILGSAFPPYRITGSKPYLTLEGIFEQFEQLLAARLFL